MSEHQFRFDDGAAYERMMGTWSRLVGDVFLDWLSPRLELRWIDVGCGNGAFTERVIERGAPAVVCGNLPECLRRKLPSPTRDAIHCLHSSTRAVPWRCPFQRTDSMPLSWRW